MYFFFNLHFNSSEKLSKLLDVTQLTECSLYLLKEQGCGSEMGWSGVQAGWCLLHPCPVISLTSTGQRPGTPISCSNLTSTPTPAVFPGKPGLRASMIPQSVGLALFSG